MFSLITAVTVKAQMDSLTSEASTAVDSSVLDEGLHDLSLSAGQMRVRLSFQEG